MVVSPRQLTLWSWKEVKPVERQAQPIESNKKTYATPLLIRHGDVDELTKHGGFSKTDVPIGTPVVDGDVTSVAS